MSASNIYIRLTDDLRGLLADNNLSIQDILDQADMDAEVKHAPPPIPDGQDSRTRELLPVVQIALVSSATVLAVSLAITNVLKTLYRKPIYETYTELEEIRDKNGKVLLDENSRPIMKEVRQQVLLEPGTGKRVNKLDMKAGLQGIVLGYTAEDDSSNKKN